MAARDRCLSPFLLALVLISASCRSEPQAGYSEPACRTPVCVSALERLPASDAVLLPIGIAPGTDFARVKYSLASDQHRDTDHILLISRDEASGEDGIVSLGVTYATIECDDGCSALGPFEGQLIVEFASTELARRTNLSVAGVDVLVGMPVGTIVRSNLAEEYFSPLSLSSDELNE